MSIAALQDPEIRIRFENADWLKPGTDAWTEDGAGALECLWDIMVELGEGDQGIDERTWLLLRKLAIQRYST